MIIKTFIGILLILAISCSHKNNVPFQKIALSVVADTTDKIAIDIQSDPLLRLYELDKRPDNEALFRFRVIKDVKLVPVTTYHLPSAGDETGGDPQARNRAVVFFYSRIRRTVDSFQTAAKNIKELTNSECFFSINEELNMLAESNYDRKFLVVVSNLFENSFINVYSEKINTDELYNVFEKNCRLKKLDGIKIFFVFNPEQDRVADQRYETIVLAYKKLYEGRGAIVNIQASAENFN